MEWLRGTSARREFERFVDEATASLLRTGLLITWDLAEAEDLLQEAFLRTAKRWPAIQKMDHPQAYVRRILINLALAESKRRSRARTELGVVGDQVLEQQADQRPEQELVAVEARSDLLTMLAELPRGQRAVLALRYFEDLSEAETASCLGWPLGTVKSTAARALDRLHRSFDGSGMTDVVSRHETVSLQEGAQDDQPT